MNNAAVEKLFMENYSFIRELVSNDPTLHFETAEKIIELIAAHLCHYRGPLTNEVFREWIADAILPTKRFASLYQNCAASVRESIQKVFGNCLDLGITSEHFSDVEQNLWLWVWQHLEELRGSGDRRAKIKTRLCAQAKYQALTIRKRLIREKERKANVSLSRIGSYAGEFEYTGLVIEPLVREELDTYMRRETLSNAA